MVAVPALISLALELELERRLAWAAFRTVVQLTGVGYLIEIVYNLEAALLVVAILLAMLVVSAWTSVGQSRHSYPWARLRSFGALGIASISTVAVAAEVVIGVEPWYDPQYVIPLFGMMLGSGLTAVTLSMDGLLEHLRTRKPQIEARLALGASAWRAVLPWFRDAIRQSMIPVINTMLIVGIVKLPGMMSGQILSGVSPVQAAAYQILIMFMIAACTSVTAICVSLLTFYRLKHPEHRIRWEMIRVRDEQ